MNKLSNEISSICTCTGKTGQKLIPAKQLFAINTITAPTDDYHTLGADYTLLSCIFHNLTRPSSSLSFFNFNVLVLLLSSFLCIYQSAF